MNTNALNRAFSKPMAVGLVTLLLGVLIGVGAEKYSVLSMEQTPKDQTVDASFFKGGELQIPPLDMLFPAAAHPWDPFRKMQDVQAEMDKMFQNSISRFNAGPLMDPFKNDMDYSPSLDVRELKDRFEVRAYLPDAKASDANVKLEGNRLQVEVTHRQANSLQNTNAVLDESVLEHYMQAAELPGKLNGNQMKVEPKDHELLITIPKSK